MHLLGDFDALGAVLEALAAVDAVVGLAQALDALVVGGEEGLAAALLVADEGVLPSVGLLVGAQVACCAVGAGTALKGALVPLYLADGGHLVSGTTELPSA